MLDQMRQMSVFLACPISHEIMCDPVLASDGKTYEREAIEDFFLKNRGKKILSPLDNQTEMTELLIPNDSMRSMIQQFIAMNPILMENVL